MSHDEKVKAIQKAIALHSANIAAVAEVKSTMAAAKGGYEHIIVAALNQALQAQLVKIFDDT